MIRFRSVELTRSTPVLCGVDLSVDTGNAVLLSGPSGAGKSTIIELIYGAAHAEAGTVEVLGRDVGRLRRTSLARLRRHIGVVPQTLELLDCRSVAANLALPLQVQAAPRSLIRVRVAQTLERLDMSGLDDTPIRDLSMGERQLVALGRALIAEPRVLLCDEPTAHLDLRGRTTAIELIAEALDNGCAALIASTDHRLLCAGAHMNWSHLELCNGVIQVVADRTEPADDDAPAHSVTPEVAVDPGYSALVAALVG